MQALRFIKSICICGIIPSVDSNRLSLLSVHGTIERIIFYNEENGYTVARLVPEGKSYVVTVIGYLMGVNVGESLELEGVWTSHPEYGRQFEIRHFTVQLPATIQGLKKYLGPVLASLEGVGTAVKAPVAASHALEMMREAKIT